MGRQHHFTLAKALLVLCLIIEGFSSLTAKAFASTDINAAWLAQRTSPYLLNTPGEIYTLQTDVTVTGTAFVIAEANITFDLNGHTIKFGDSDPIIVNNGGFENGLIGWNVTGAPTATTKAARDGMWGASMLEITNITSTQTLVSDPINIPVSGREYAATITPKGSAVGSNGQSSYDEVVTLKVIDAVTGQVLGTKNSPAVSRGFAPVVFFTPTTTNPVKLEVDIVPVAGTTGRVDLDYAAVFASRDFGVVATEDWIGNLPPQLQGLPSSITKAANVVIKNGSIIQGKSHSYGSNSLYLRAITGATVEQVSSFVNGMDGKNAVATGSNGVTINNSTFQSSIDNISDRMLIFSAIDVANVYGPTVITNNTILDAPQCGIFAGGNHSNSNYVITGNTIKEKSIATDGYGILMNGIVNFVIANNTIQPVNGRGIIIDNFNSAISQNGEIYGNTVQVQEKGNLEYAPSSLSVAALRLRNLHGGHRNIHIHDNVFSVITGPGLDYGAEACWFSEGDANGFNHNANLLFERNTCKTVLTTADSNYFGFAISISHVDPGTGLTFSNNIVESNDVSLEIGDSDSWEFNNEDILFVSNTLRRSTDAGAAARNYVPIDVGEYKNSVHNIRLIDTKFASGGNIKFATNYKLARDVGTGFLLNVKVQNGAAGPVTGATVNVVDKAGASVPSMLTDAQGFVSNIPVVTTILTQSTVDTSIVTTDTRNPLTVTATFGNLTAQQSVDLTSNQTVVIDLSGASIDNIPPTVSITAPTGGTVSEMVELSANATDNVIVVGVQFQLDGMNLGSEVTGTPYTVPWNTTLTSNGNHALTAIARDSVGNTKTSSVVFVTVSNTTTPPPTNPPVIPPPVPVVPPTNPGAPPSNPGSNPPGGIVNLFSNGSAGVINFNLSTPTHVTIKIFSRGRVMIKELTDQDYPAGMNTVSWDGRNMNGEKVASGIYVAVITPDGQTPMKQKMAVVR